MTSSLTSSTNFKSVKNRALYNENRKRKRATEKLLKERNMHKNEEMKEDDSIDKDFSSLLSHYDDDKRLNILKYALQYSKHPLKISLSIDKNTAGMERDRLPSKWPAVSARKERKQRGGKINSNHRHRGRRLNHARSSEVQNDSMREGEKKRDFMELERECVSNGNEREQERLAENVDGGAFGRNCTALLEQEILGVNREGQQNSKKLKKSCENESTGIHINHILQDTMSEKKPSQQEQENPNGLREELSNWKKADFKQISFLGEGASGIVLLMQNKRNSQLYAIKETHNTESTQEREIHQKLKHENILNFEGFWMEGNSIFSRLEIAENGSLFSFLYTHRRDLSRKMRLKIFLELCLAVNYLHTKDIMHGDIKPGNILLGTDLVVKLADFGCASNQIKEMR